MVTTFPIDVYRNELAQIVASVFETMLRLPSEPATAEWKPEPDRVTSAVYFAGEWRGAVLLECGCEQAYEFASRLMPGQKPTTMTDDVRDTLGELANMLAGNLKSVLPRGVGLSMPSVVEGADYSLRVCGGNLVDRVPFRTPTGLIWVMLIEMKE